MRPRPVAVVIIGCLLTSLAVPATAAAQSVGVRSRAITFQPARPVVIQSSIVLPGQPWIAVPVFTGPVVVRALPPQLVVRPARPMTERELKILKWTAIVFGASVVARKVGHFPFKQ